jgi:kynurenine formamidase
MCRSSIIDEIGVPQELRDAAGRVSNWGKWGDSDELGTLNYLTPPIISRAASLITSGRTYALSIPLDAYGPQGSNGFRRNPIHLMTLDGGDADIAQLLNGWGGATERRIEEIWRGPMHFTDDFVIMPLQAATQWDALSHVYYERQLYNGYNANTITSLGATRNSIDQVAKSGLVAGRGVLLDVARHNGLSYLRPGTKVTPEALTEVARAQDVDIREGDIILVRTGWWARYLETRDAAEYTRDAPGIDWRCAFWFSEKRVAAVASDNPAVEVASIEFPGVVLPFHMLALRDMGMMLGEMWNLEDLSLACAEDGNYQFFLSAQPLLITGAVGSPVNPVAIK